MSEAQTQCGAYYSYDVSIPLGANSAIWLTGLSIGRFQSATRPVECTHLARVLGPKITNKIRLNVKLDPKRIEKYVTNALKAPAPDAAFRAR